MSVREITEDMLDWFAKDIGAIAFEMQRALERHRALSENAWTGGDTSERAPSRTTKAMSLLRRALALVTEADHEAALFRAEGDAVEIEVSEFPLSVYDDGDVHLRTVLHQHSTMWTDEGGRYRSEETRRHLDGLVNVLIGDAQSALATLRRHLPNTEIQVRVALNDTLSVLSGCLREAGVWINFQRCNDGGPTSGTDGGIFLRRVDGRWESDIAREKLARKVLAAMIRDWPPFIGSSDSIDALGDDELLARWGS